MGRGGAGDCGIPALLPGAIRRTPFAISDASSTRLTRATRYKLVTRVGSSKLPVFGLPLLAEDMLNDQAIKGGVCLLACFSFDSVTNCPFRMGSRPDIFY